jgi:hypothetical protein
MPLDRAKRIVGAWVKTAGVELPEAVIAGGKVISCNGMQSECDLKVNMLNRSFGSV